MSGPEKTKTATIPGASAPAKAPSEASLDPRAIYARRAERAKAAGS